MRRRFRSELPGADRAMLVRERLLAQLGARWFAPVTVLTAPAGYGKTTLLAQAIAANSGAPRGIDCWLTCGPDLAAASALGEALCEAAGAPLPPAGARTSRGDEVDVVAAAVGEALWRRSPQQVALVLDDVHEIPPDSEGARLLAAVVASLPANGHVVLAGRLDPPVPLARLDLDGRVVRLRQGDLAFTEAEMAAFAALRGVPRAQVVGSGGWPALAELSASARADVAGDYVGQEVLSQLPPERRRSLALLAHIGPFDEELARAALGPATQATATATATARAGEAGAVASAAVAGPPVDVAALVAGIPLVSQSVPLPPAGTVAEAAGVAGVADGPGVAGAGEPRPDRRGVVWSLHGLWQSLLGDDVSPAEIAEARRRTAATLLDRGEVGSAVRLLTDAEAWDELGAAIVESLGAAHPPVPHDVLTDWYERLPPDVRARPSGRLLEAVVAAEPDPRGSWPRFEAAAAAFRAEDDLTGELACLVQLGQLAWWSEETDRLAALALRVFQLEAEGCAEAVPLACLGRALLSDMQNDSRQTLAELDRIPPGSLSDVWQGLVSWVRAFSLLQLGLVSEALDATNHALAHAGAMHAPLAMGTWLQAQWYMGNIAVLDTFDDVLRRIRDAGYRNHTALVAAQCSVGLSLVGQVDRAREHLGQARTAAASPDAPLVDTALTMAEAALAVARDDEATATELLTAYVDRHPVYEGLSAGPQLRNLTLLYVLVPGARKAWDAADLGPVHVMARDLAQAVVAVRETGRLPRQAPAFPEPRLVQAHLPVAWAAQLGLAAVAAGREDGWELLDAVWPAARPSVQAMARDVGPGELRGPVPVSPALQKVAREAIGRLAVPPTHRLRLRLLGPVELRREGALVDAPDWRRERVRSLLAYLVLHGTASRGEVGDALWPTLDTEAQSRNLRVTLTYLLRVLEPERGQRDASFFIRQHGGNLSLHTGDWLTVDLWEFDAECDAARDAERRGAPGLVLEHTLRAVELWRGEPTELLSEASAVGPMEQRRLRFAGAAIRAGELLLAQGQLDDATTLAERALAIDPWLEAAHRLIVAVHRASGDDLAARRALGRYRDAIHELGLGPEEATLMVERLLDSREVAGARLA